MQRFVVAMVLVALACGCGAHQSASTTVSSTGVRVVMPRNWMVVRPAPDAPVIDPLTMLVVGTEGVRARSSQCQIAAYRVPAEGAVVVVVGWAGRGGSMKPGRAPLKTMTTVRKPELECFSGRGAAAQVRLRGKVYQVNVMVGDRASKRRVAEALAVARSFNVAGSD